MAHVPYDRVLWRDIAWDDVFEGKTNASCYYMRAGLIRKDLLPLYAGEDAPATVVVANAATLHDAVSVSACLHMFMITLLNVLVSSLNHGLLAAYGCSRKLQAPTPAVSCFSAVARAQRLST